MSKRSFAELSQLSLECECNAENIPPSKKRKISCSQTSCSQIMPFDMNELPDVMIQNIISFNTPYEWSLIISPINKSLNSQCKIMWKRLHSFKLSPQMLPSLIYDDYDSQVNYNETRRPDRVHSTLNAIIDKLENCKHLNYLKISKTMMNAIQFRRIIQKCCNLTSLNLCENPCIFLMGNDYKFGTNSNHDQDVNEKNNEIATFKLQTFVMKLMHLDLTHIQFSRLLQSSYSTLKSLILRKRDPFYCWNCKLQTLCKLNKCQSCQMRSYCSKECQSEDWWYHQYVCPYHPSSSNSVFEMNLNSLQSIDGYLNTICSFTNLVTLDVSYCFAVNEYALNNITFECKKLENLYLNGCNINDNGLVALAKNMSCLKILHLRGCSMIKDNAIMKLSEMHADTLVDLDINRCLWITRIGVSCVVSQCKNLENLGIACGLKRGGFIWKMDDVLGICILNNLKKLKKLQYIGGVCELLSEKVRNDINGMNDGTVLIHEIETQIELTWNAQNRLVYIHQSYDNNKLPVLVKTIENGKVISQQRFKR